MPHSGSTGATTDPVVIEEALRFGALVLPAAARVLGVQPDDATAQRYRLAIGIDLNSVQTLLSGSGFNTPPEPDPGPFPMPIDGFDLTTATAVSATSAHRVWQSGPAMSVPPPAQDPHQLVAVPA